MKASIVAFLTSLASMGYAQAVEYSGVCPSGAQVQEKYCGFFSHYNTTDGPLDVRIRDALNVSSSSQTRSIGLVIAIDKYPNLPGRDISAAAVDGKRLTEFLIKEQKFDEVITLRNDEATSENINYFLDEYLYYRGQDFGQKGRLLIAYSGHGRQGDLGESGRAAFILSAAKDFNGSANTYRMQELAGRVESLAKQYFHVLTLINSCYAGSFFRDGKSGNADAYQKKGSYALTAGTDADSVSALDPARGSLFFDLLIDGVTKGSADPQYWQAYTYGTETLGLTRTLALTTFLTSSYARISFARRQANSQFSLSVPSLSPAQAGTAWGGFFFLSNQKTTSGLELANKYGRLSNMGPSRGLTETSATRSLKSLFGISISAPNFTSAIDVVNVVAAPTTQQLPPPNIPTGPVSSIRGRPDIKIFKPPEVYPVHGYDFSSANGAINWYAIADAQPPKFIYLRAIGWSGVDETFSTRLDSIKSLGVDYGVYVKYDFCQSPTAQLVRIAAVMPVDKDALPMAIEIVQPGNGNVRQLQCLDSAGIDRAKEDILELAKIIQQNYGKIPLMYGNRNSLSKFLDERSNKYMIWLGNYGSTVGQLYESNPWTIWQYTGTLDIAGVGLKSTGNVFFGTQEQYKMFREGKSNVALEAVTIGPLRH